MNKFKEACIEILRKAGCRITQQRIAVIDCISHAKEPLSAPEIFEILSAQQKGAPIDKVSVYRTLDTLLEHNLVHRAPPHGAYLACTHQQCHHDHHIMARCVRCNHVIEVEAPDEVVSPLLAHMKRAFRFSPDSHLLHMEGVCVSCSK